jgi:hypothetical protein
MVLSSYKVSASRYDDPQLRTGTRGIHLVSSGKVAWFKVPDGNTFALEQ